MYSRCNLINKTYQRQSSGGQRYASLPPTLQVLPVFKSFPGQKLLLFPFFALLVVKVDQVQPQITLTVLLRLLWAVSSVCKSP